MCLINQARNFISIHAPTRGATSKYIYMIYTIRFQSTLPREERLFVLLSHNPAYAYFNPRSHERSDRYSTMLLHRSKYFNPRSHERSDRAFILCSLSSVISIHAPTRGATWLPLSGKWSFLFQSTLPREERHITVYPLKYYCRYFNPRSHERSDVPYILIYFSQVISIHAPTRGATAILHKKFVYFYTIPTINI